MLELGTQLPVVGEVISSVGLALTSPTAPTTTQQTLKRESDERESDAKREREVEHVDDR